MRRLTIALAVLLLGISGLAQAQQFKVLVFTKTAGWHHKAQLESVAALQKMAREHHFEMEWHEDATRINTENLEQFDLIMFVLTTGDVLNEEQQEAMEAFIRSGKGFVGVHSASDTEYDWPWYMKMVGRHFLIHPVIQTARVKVEQPGFPGLAAWPASQLMTDEWYEFSEPHSDGLITVLSVDESSYDPNVQWGELVGKGMGEDHPIAWYHEYDGGRAFYTGLGHVEAMYENPWFLAHLYGGMYWAATGKGLADAE